MKRYVFGVIWFIVFSFGGLFLGGAIVGGIAGAQVEAGGISEAAAKGHQAGHAAGAEFGRKYSGLIFLGALVLAVAGTATGVLPGTRKKNPGAAGRG